MNRCSETQRQHRTRDRADPNQGRGVRGGGVGWGGQVTHAPYYKTMRRKLERQGADKARNATRPDETLARTRQLLHIWRRVAPLTRLSDEESMEGNKQTI